ncbi:ammonia channel precursor (ammonia transporter) [Escherichia coli]|uniref:Ammonia channel (Ammonia transporter) n=1 Tax=Escherichia coli TaxID=562 RepID=A0A376KZM3_ECOLX|nr:ammonia channel precursor (ammonia transporter) [Escherichia coli]
MKIATIKTGLASLAMLPGLVMAAPAVADKADNAFMMICTALVLFMTIPGIALFYGGLIRGKNVLSMLTQVTGDVCTGLYSLGGLRLLAGVW